MLFHFIVSHQEEVSVALETVHTCRETGSPIKSNQSCLDEAQKGVLGAAHQLAISSRHGENN